VSSGKYFNKGVKALDSPHVGHVVREADETIVVFGEGGDRYDIPKSEVRFAAANVLVDLLFSEIAKKYKVSRDAPLPASAEIHEEAAGDVDLAAYEKKYPRSLFNKGVRSQDEEHVGHVMKETSETIIVWGHRDWRFDIPKSRIVAVGRNVIVGLDYKDVFQYKVDRDAPVPAEEEAAEE
jgi:hypothetical protein